MKKVLLQGAFDIINYGHVAAFQTMRALAGNDGQVIVAVNTDKLLKEYKNVEAVIPWWQKKIIIESIRHVDLVVPATDFSPLELLERYDIDVYCLTKEWEHTKSEEIDFMKKKNGRVYFMPRFPDVVSTSEIKRLIIANKDVKPLTAEDH